MKKKLSTFFDIEFTDVSLRKVFIEIFDITVEIIGGEGIRFFVYTDAENFRLNWYGSSLEANDSEKILYLQAVAKIVTVLSDKENLLSLIDMLRSAK